jgi:hypothetical protein
MPCVFQSRRFNDRKLRPVVDIDNVVVVLKPFHPFILHTYATPQAGRDENG